jgi:hypothetical protein
MLRALLLLGTLALCPGTLAPSHSDTAQPTREEFARRVWRAFTLDYQIQKDFIFQERRRDIRISKLGRVTVGPLRTFEVHPSGRPGTAYKRLIAIDGKPLPPEELAARDAQHARDLETTAARARTETPQQRATREKDAADQDRHRTDMLADAAAVFEAVTISPDTIDGFPVLAAELKPRQNARVKTREGRWMKRFAGRVWVAASDYQLVKIDMRAFDDITIGWGVIGRINKGSRVLYTRKRYGPAWLPSQLTYDASGRTLLFRPFQFAVTTTYSDYEKR